MTVVTHGYIASLNLAAWLGPLPLPLRLVDKSSLNGGNMESSDRPFIERQPCLICGNKGPHNTYRAFEMMFGTRDPFDYLECPDCGTLQIAAVPANLPDYYPPNYYAFGKIEESSRRFGWLSRKLKERRVAYALHRNSLVGLFVAKVKGYWPYYDWFRAAGISRDHAILDLGCGRGELLFRLHSEGFTNLTGVDPYIAGSVSYDNGIRILKAFPGEVVGLFDLVMFNHSLEHIPDPIGALRAARRLMSPAASLMVATPVVAWAWEHYGVNWVQLDAPRHLFVPSERAMRAAATRAGLKVTGVFYNSTDFMFVGSEMYKRGIPLKPGGMRFPAEHPAPKKLFSAQEIRDFKSRAAKLNREGCGDQACFIMQPA